jgi:hypothetical protein
MRDRPEIALSEPHESRKLDRKGLDALDATTVGYTAGTASAQQRGTMPRKAAKSVATKVTSAGKIKVGKVTTLGKSVSRRQQNPKMLKKEAVPSRPLRKGESSSGVTCVVRAARRSTTASVGTSPSVEASIFEKRLLDALRQLLRRQLHSIEESDNGLTSLGAPEVIAASMAKLLPVSHPFDSTVGPFYDTPGLTTWLGVSRQRLHQRVQSHSLLACPVEGGPSVYPIWQFQSNGELVPGLAEVLAIMSEGTKDSWQIALWLSVPNSRLNGLPPRQWLVEERDVEPVRALAKETAARWRR